MPSVKELGSPSGFPDPADFWDPLEGALSSSDNHETVTLLYTIMDKQEIVGNGGGEGGMGW